MANFNSCTFMGNLGQDVEVRDTRSGKAVANFSIAVNSGFGDNKKTAWIKVTCWDKMADSAARFLKKGSCVLVAGELTVEQWEGRDGRKGTTVGLTARSLTFVSGTRQQDGDARDGRPERDRGRGRNEEPEVEDDIPF